MPCSAPMLADAERRPAGPARPRRARRLRSTARRSGCSARKCCVRSAVRYPLRERGVLERHMHADVAGRRIHRADEGDHGDENEMLEARDRDPGRDHQGRAGEQQRAQVVARRHETRWPRSVAAEPSSAAVATSPIWNGSNPISIR